MIQKPTDILEQFPVRKSKLQKAQFRDAVMEYIRPLGYTCKAETGSMGAVNVVFGNQAEAKYLVTAHYDTCATMPFPNLITPCNFFLYLLYQIGIVLLLFLIAGAGIFALKPLLKDSILAGQLGFLIYWALLLLMIFGPANKPNANDNTSGVVTLLELARNLPEELREDVCFVLFDLEEAGLIGSSSYRKKHKKETNSQLVLNLDCVGDGDHLVFFPSRKVKKNAAMLAGLNALEITYPQKNLKVHTKGFSMYPSDQANFPYGVGIAAFHKSKWAGLYLGRIHTWRDTICEEENIQILKDSLLKLISGDSNR